MRCTPGSAGGLEVPVASDLRLERVIAEHRGPQSKTTSRPLGTVFQGEESPRLGHAVQRAFAAMVEAQARSHHQVLDRARHEDLARAGGRGDPRADVDGDPAYLGSGQLALAGVQAGPCLHADRADRGADRLAAADRPGRAVEHREEAIAGGVDLAAAEALELAAHERMVTLEQAVPALVAELCRTGGGADDVGEEQRQQRSSRSGPRRTPVRNDSIRRARHRCRRASRGGRRPRARPAWPRGCTRRCSGLPRPE